MTTKLNRLKELCERATKGPWEWDGKPWDYDTEQEAPWLIGVTGRLQDRVLAIYDGNCVSEDDAKLITESRNALPDLLTLVSEMAAALEYISKPNYGLQAKAREALKRYTEWNQ